MSQQEAPLFWSAGELMLILPNIALFFTCRSFHNPLPFWRSDKGSCGNWRGSWCLRHVSYVTSYLMQNIWTDITTPAAKEKLGRGTNLRVYNLYRFRKFAVQWHRHYGCWVYDLGIPASNFSQFLNEVMKVSNHHYSN